MKTKDRLWCLFGGLAAIWHGSHVAGQAEGTYYFSIVTSLAPVLAAGWLLQKAYQRCGATRPATPS